MACFVMFFVTLKKFWSDIEFDEALPSTRCAAGSSDCLVCLVGVRRSGLFPSGMVYTSGGQFICRPLELFMI